MSRINKCRDKIKYLLLTWLWKLPKPDSPQIIVDYLLALLKFPAKLAIIRAQAASGWVASSTRKDLDVCIRKWEGRFFFHSLYVSLILITSNEAASSFLQSLSTLYHQPYVIKPKQLTQHLNEWKQLLAIGMCASSYSELGRNQKLNYNIRFSWSPPSDTLQHIVSYLLFKACSNFKFRP